MSAPEVEPQPTPEPVPTPTPPAEPEPTATPEPPETTPETKVFDERYVGELREEAAKWRTRLRETEEREKALADKVKEFEDSQLSEQEKVAKELEEARAEAAKAQSELGVREARIREALLEADVVKASVTPDLRIQDPDAAFLLMDRSEIEWDDDTGRAKNLPEVLAKLIEQRPYLVAAEGTVPTVLPAVGPTNPPREPAEKVPTRAELATMTSDEINDLWEKGLLPKALEEGRIR